MSAYLTHITCLECGHELPGAIMTVSCPACGSQWLDARYDYDAVAAQWASGVVQTRGRSLWRYGELLPISDPDPEISMGEGFTPLVRLYQYEREFNHPHLYIKDERHMPTNSFKDRQAAMAVTAMRQAGIHECVLASTGNAAVAYAAYCARAGIKLWLFLTSLVPAEKMRETAIYGAEVVKVSGTYDEAKHIAAEFAGRKGIHLERGAKAVPGKESMKTLAYEIAEQLGLQLAADGRWHAPDWYIQAVSGGIGPLGVWKGFAELLHMGMIDHMPRLGIIQVAGCSPMVQAFQAGLPKATPVQPKTLIHVLATGEPGFAYALLRDAALSNGGVMLAVEDGDAFRALRHLASRAGISVEPATSVAFAGLEKMLNEGMIAPDDTVVINCSGHTFPVESHILGDRYFHDLELHGQAEDQGSGGAGLALHEGLGAALQNLDEQVTSILIVDDNPNDRRLIRRLLNRYKRYRIYEARNGAEAVKVVKDYNPDLMVIDLTMPEMDGFELLTRLKTNPDTAHIPVVVVSAKSLTEQDRHVLETYSESVWTKGGFDTRELVDHVVSVLGHEPVASSETPVPRKPRSERAESETHQAGRHTIMVIDDNPQDLKLVRRLLQGSGRYNIIEADSGREGLKAIYEHRPDLLILDLVLPDMDGFEIVERMQNDVNLYETPVILFTARDLSHEQLSKVRGNIRLVAQKASLNSQALLTAIDTELGN